MSSIEEEYDRRIAEMTPRERMRRAEAMLRFARDLIAREIQREEGPLDSEIVKWKVAARMYGSDPRTMSLIAEGMKRVSAGTVSGDA